MTRVVELFVIANAVCGIAAFLIARGVIRWIKRKWGMPELPPAEPPKNLGRKEIDP